MARAEDQDDVSSTHSKDTLLGNASRRTQYDAIEISDNRSVKTHRDDSSIASKDRGENKLGSLNLMVLTICLCIGAALPSIDVSIIFTTMTEIGSQFHRANLSTWIHSSYTLCSLVTMPTAGKLSDAFGRKPVLVTLSILFLIGSIGCGYAQSFMQVIVARAIQGFGGGGLPLMANVIIHDVVPSEKLGSYQSYISTIQTLGFALGAPIGGFIADAFGWRYCFKVNILPLLIVLYVFFFHLPNYPLNNNEGLSVKEKLRRVDFLGIFFLSFGTWSFMCAFLLGGNTHAWNSPLVLSALCAAACSFTLFVVHQNHWSKYPLLTRAAYDDRNFTGACLGIFLAGLSESGAVLIIPQFVMGVLDFNTSDAGAWLMIESIAVPVGCFVAGRYMQRTGRFYWFLLFNVGMYVIALIILYNWIGQNVGIIGGTAGIIVQGIAYGAAVVPMIVSVSSTIASELVASALSMYMLTRSVGYLVGVGVSTSVIQGNLKALLVKRIDGPDAEEVIEFVRTSIRKIHELSPELQQIVKEVLATSLQRGTLFLICSSVLALIAVSRMQNVNMKTKDMHVRRDSTSS